MLSGSRIRQVLEHGTLEFNGAVRGHGLLLTLGRSLLAFSEDRHLVDPFDASSIRAAYRDHDRDWSFHDLPPQGSVLVSSKEYIRLPGSLAGVIGTLSHVARLGLFSHFSSQFIGPGFAGHITFELLNVSPHDLRLRPGMPVAKVVIISTEGQDPTSGPNTQPLLYNSAPGEELDLRSRFADEFGDRHGY